MKSSETKQYPVSFAQTNYYNARRNLISAKRGLLDYRIQLVTALGGSWTNQIIEDYKLTSQLHQETIQP